MNVETEILAAPEIRQSDIETQIYDQHARFYEYGETGRSDAEKRAAKSPRKNILGRALLFAAAVLALFGGLPVVFFYFTENFWPPVSVNQVSAENLPDVETDDSARAGQAEQRENGLAPEKIVKNLPADDKNNFENREENKPFVAASSKTNEKNAFPDTNPKTDGSTEKKNPPVMKNEIRRDVRPKPVMVEKTSPPPTVETRRPQKDPVFRKSPKDRPASSERRTNVANADRRIVFRERQSWSKRKN